MIFAAVPVTVTRTRTDMHKWGTVACERLVLQRRTASDLVAIPLCAILRSCLELGDRGAAKRRPDRRHPRTGAHEQRRTGIARR